jgi:hypothetical protein
MTHKSKIILGMGTGRCGTLSLAEILNAQPNTHVTHEEAPLLPWDNERNSGIIAKRFDRMRRKRNAEFIGDIASFYLPYAEEIIKAEPDVRIICLKRAKDAVVKSFCRWLDLVHPLPTNHWAKDLPPGWHYEPNWSRIFPKYDIQSRDAGIARYWDEYNERAEILAKEFPDHLRIVDMEQLNDGAGVSELLSFVGIPKDQQVNQAGHHTHKSSHSPTQPVGNRASAHPMDPRKCVILVPYTGSIVPQCEQSLKELERRGYTVRRVRGYAAIDQGRNQLATNALKDGFEETMWIDSDVGFFPDAIEKLRKHNLPISCGIYPKKGKRELACHVLPGTPKMTFGEGGGLIEILYAGTGFLHIRREVYRKIQEELKLPMCNERFGETMIPFFHPMLYQRDDGYDYLAEDYSFSQRARDCGFQIMADTTVRLWHVGMYAYGWEDSGREPERFGSFTLNFNM